MSVKSKISNGTLLFISCFSLSIRRLIGNKIVFSPYTLISPFVTIKTDLKGEIHVGKMVGIKKNTEVSATGGTITLGDNCFINRNCMIVAHKRIKVGKGTTIGPNVCIYDHDHSIGGGGYTSSPITIGNNVWIGANSTILKGVVIGDSCTVGAGCLITKDIPSNCTVIQKRENTIIYRSD